MWKTNDRKGEERDLDGVVELLSDIDKSTRISSVANEIDSTTSESIPMASGTSHNINDAPPSSSSGSVNVSGFAYASFSDEKDAYENERERPRRFRLGTVEEEKELQLRSENRELPFIEDPNDRDEKKSEEGSWDSGRTLTTHPTSSTSESTGTTSVWTGKDWDKYNDPL